MELTSYSKCKVGDVLTCGESFPPYIKKGLKYKIIDFDDGFAIFEGVKRAPIIPEWFLDPDHKFMTRCIKIDLDAIGGT